MKYHVACEEFENNGLGFYPITGFSILYFEATIDPPINAQRLYDLINKDRPRKTGRVISWSKIEE